jgi:FtsZ-interacting cell division protein ZipA
MQPLRWTLLILGALFIAALTWWEWRGGRRRQDAGVPERAPRGAVRKAAPLLGRRSAPELGEPATVEAHDPPLDLPPLRGREPVRALPVIDLPEDDALPARESPMLATANADEDGAGHEPSMSAVAPDVLRAVPLREDSEDAAIAGAVAGAAIPTLGPLRARDELTGEAPARELPAPSARPAARVDWPAEPQRRILAARLVATSERFSGRALRLAFAAEGLEHGPMGIFHRVLEDGRVSWSAASLTKPGSFDLTSMDSVHFAGLHLFAVLPGALPDGEVSGDLTATARRLAERLGGELRDEGGRPLEAQRTPATSVGGRA